MISLQTISEKLDLSAGYFNELINQQIADFTRCGQSVVTPTIICLNRIMRALTWDVAYGVNDQTTQDIYSLLLKQLAKYSGSVLPFDPNVVIPGQTIIVINEPGDIMQTNVVYPGDGELEYTFSELIDQDALLVYRGTGTTLRVHTGVPTDDFAQLDSMTGKITVKYPFSENEGLWVEYKTT